MEQGVEARAVGLEDLGVVLRQRGQQEEAEHAAFTVRAEGHTFGSGCSGQAIDQGTGGGRQGVEKSGLADLTQRGQPTRWPPGCRQRAGLVHRAQRRGVP